MNTNCWTDETVCEHFGEEEVAPCRAVVRPMYLTSLHTFDTIDDMMALHNTKGDYVYGRIANPTVELLEDKINALEKGQGALCFGSGMAAITSAVLSCVKPGGHIVAVKNCYGPAHQFFVEQLKAKWNIEVMFVDGKNPDDFENAIQPNTQLFYLESPSSVVLSLQNLPAVTKIAHAHGIKTAIDNTWATPLFQKPLTMGVDLSIHTMSKYIGGHSDLIGGVLVCADGGAYESIKHTERELLGGILGPFEAWLCIRGLRSLPARLALHQNNAMVIAERLANAPEIQTLFYPGHPDFPQYELAKRQMGGFTGLMSFIPHASLEQTKRFIERMKLFRIGCSWGGFESLAIMPMAAYTDEAARALGGAPNLVRMFVGQENVEDLWRDIEQAFEALR